MSTRAPESPPRQCEAGGTDMSLAFAKEAFRDAQRRFDHTAQPGLYDLALGMRLLVEGIEREFQALNRRLADVEEAYARQNEPFV